MIENESVNSLYKWDRINVDGDTFRTTIESYSMLKNAVYKPKKQRKKMRKDFFSFGYRIYGYEVRIWINYDLDIKRHKTHARITKAIKLNSLTKKQLKKYRGELFRIITYMKLLRSQLRFKLLPEYFTPNYDFHIESIERQITK